MKTKFNIAVIRALMARYKPVKETIDWFRSKKMVVNPNKFQSLLGIEIDNKLNFEKHVTALC